MPTKNKLIMVWPLVGHRYIQDVTIKKKLGFEIELAVQYQFSLNLFIVKLDALIKKSQKVTKTMSGDLM